MEDIKRYRTVSGVYCSGEDVDKLITDHKAEVETLENETIRDLKEQIQYLNGDVINFKGKIEELEKERSKLITPFKMSWDKWNIDLSEIEEGTMKMFKVSQMSTSNNYTCWDKDRNEYHTRECLTLSEELSEIIDSKGD